MSRLTTARLQQLAAQLPARYTTPLPHLRRARVLTGDHLDQLLAEPGAAKETAARVRRRIMTRLGDLGLVETLQRRIGGVRAGSAGHVYTLTGAGYRFLALLNGTPPPRTRPTRAPGALFLDHALRISGLYVDLIHASSTAGFRVTAFVTEPSCWWPLGDGAYLRPDAYTVLQVPTHSDCWWLEIDTGTESVACIKHKCRTYREFFQAGHVGPDNAPPRVLFTTPDEQRTRQIRRGIAMSANECGDLIAAIRHEHAAAFLVAELQRT